MRYMLDRWIANRILRRLAQAPAVALLGARQVGKTTLGMKIAEDRGWIYLDLQNRQDRRKLEDPYAFLRSHRDTTVVLDEIQRTPDLFVDLRVIIDEYRRQGRGNGRFLILGSASMDLLRQSSESLAGRIRHVSMSGLNLLEAGDDMRKLWFRGGFPESFLALGNDASRIAREALIETCLARDMPGLGFSVSSEKMRRIFTMLAHAHGQAANRATLADNLEVDSKTIGRWTHILTGLLLVRRLEPYCTNVKKRLVKTPRLYVRDSGLLHELLEIESHDRLLGHVALGKSWEGFVIENVCSLLPEYARTYFYRTSAGAEIDLVVSLSSDEKWAIEIKHGSTPKLSRRFGQSCEEIGAAHRYVVYGGDETIGIRDGATMIPLAKLMERLADRLAKA